MVFEADNLVTTAAKHVQQQPVPPSKCTDLEIPTALEEVVMDCLRKDPADRPASAKELADRLTHCDLAAWTEQQAKHWWELGVTGEDAS